MVQLSEQERITLLIMVGYVDKKRIHFPNQQHPIKHQKLFLGQ